MFQYKPERIVIEKDVKELTFTKNILALFPKIKPEIVSEFKWKSELPQSKKSHLTSGKKILYLKRFLGLPIKVCPGFSEEVVCCNYYVLDFIENCPLECTYCILQAFHNRPVMTLHVNVEEILEKVVKTIKSRPKQHFRVGTGEHSDSMALEPIFNINPFLVETFGNLSNATLELKTKTNYIDNLLHKEHGGNTVVSWSVNASTITLNEEHKTASLEKRIEAAKAVTEDGYQVAFHFDPLIHFENWKTDYEKTVHLIFSSIPHNKIAWISLGTLRYIPHLKHIAEARFPQLSLFCNEFVAGEDGKMRYIKPIREELLKTVANMIQKIAPSVLIYLCMEKSILWQKAMSKIPLSNQHLEKELITSVHS